VRLSHRRERRPHRSARRQQLVEFLGRELGEIERRFGDVGHQFAAVHARLDGIDQRLEDFRREVPDHFDEADPVSQFTSVRKETVDSL